MNWRYELAKGGEIRDTKTFHLSRNMSKFVAWQVLRDEKWETKPKFVAQSWPALYFSQQLSSKHLLRDNCLSRMVKNAKQWNNVVGDKLRVFVSRNSLP